jgi:hypothetical protein
MVSLSALWLPILLSAVGVFVASSIIHMFLPYHRSDYKKAPTEDAIMDDLRKANLAPGDYLIPHPGGPEHMRSEEYKNKVKRGPVVMFTVMTGFFEMGKRFIQWFVYSLVISVLASLLAAHTCPPGATFRRVFHIVGLFAFAGYGLALWPLSIWYNRSWATTIKSNIDALIYALVTAGIFGWLWPK